MKTNPLIIERPDLQVWQQKAMFSVLTAAFWVGWFVLWLPLVTLVAWFFFGYKIQIHMIELDGYRAFGQLLVVYAGVVLVMGGGLILWAKYNHLRFRGMDRRQSLAAPDDEALGVRAQHPAEVVAAWRNYAVMTVRHDPQGRIVSVRPRPVAALKTAA